MYSALHTGSHLWVILCNVSRATYVFPFYIFSSKYESSFEMTIELVSLSLVTPRVCLIHGWNRWIINVTCGTEHIA